MKYLPLIAILTTLILSCTPESTVFEMETWWSGHWQKLEDSSMFFSSGQKAIGGNEIVTPQLFISKNDSILENFHLVELVDFDHKERFKLIKTSNNSFIKIQETDDSHIEVYGPAQSIEEIDSNINEYRRLPEGAIPPIPDSILYEL